METSPLRGNLTLTLLPTSDLRISFVGDDGQVERLSTFSNMSDCSSVIIDEIPADMSRRSFLIRIPDGDIYYFWCSEKSRFLGYELLEKMKSLIKRKPTLAELTGISESRLQYFATHLRAYLVGSNAQVNSVVLRASASTTPLDLSELGQSAQSTPASSKPSRTRHCNIQGSLSPRPSSFKEGLPRNLASLRTVVREKFRRRGEGNLSCDDNFSLSPAGSSVNTSFSTQNEKGKLPESSGSCVYLSSGLDSPGILDMPLLSHESQVPSSGSSLFSPYYCWCPPVASALQYTVAPPHVSGSSIETFSLPPLSSLLSQVPRSSSLLTPKSPLNLAELPSMDFPPFLPEPLVRLPLSMQTSQQIPTFTPLMCDPIVHIPVIDICSSGQAYLVSAAPGISTTIPPLHQALVNPLIQDTESMVEKSARETLRLLISGSGKSNSQFLGVLPSVLTNSNSDEAHSIFAAGSRGFYSGSTDVNVFANNIVSMGFLSLSERSTVVSKCIDQGDLGGLEDEQGGPGGTFSGEDGSSFSDSG